MKILIVDDETKRYGRLISALIEIGVTRAQVEIVPSASDARSRMETSKYDLLILDILLSQWPDDSNPDVRHSLDLLMELHEGDDYIPPSRILGITSDLKAASATLDTFAAWTWQVLCYSSTDDEWVTQIVNCVKYLVNSAKKAAEAKVDYGTDLAIVCALEKPELEEVLRLPWNWDAARPLDDMTFVRDGYLEVGGRKITVAATFAPRMGMVSTALLSTNVINLLRPRLLAMCGICAGVRGKVDLGDVLLVDPSWDFQSGKRVKDNAGYSFSIAPHHLPSPTPIRRHLEQIRSDRLFLSSMAADFNGAPRIPAIHIGPVASGSAVLADGKIIEEIKQQHRELIGVEMEVYGMYAAAASASQPQPRAFALKSVCDFADSDKADNAQRFAAYASARVLGQ